MTPQEIIEGNKLIALFLGYVKSSSDKDFTFYTHPDGKGIITQSEHDYTRYYTHELMEARSFLFHRSWSWLMPIVEKIESLGYPVKIKMNDCWIILPDVEEFGANKDNKITSVWTAVVSFIKWYNQNKPV